jgi:hypothetical protein
LGPPIPPGLLILIVYNILGRRGLVIKDIKDMVKFFRRLLDERAMKKDVSDNRQHQMTPGTQCGHCALKSKTGHMSSSVDDIPKIHWKFGQGQ